MELQWFVGPLLDEVYDAVHVDGDDDGLLEEVAYLTGELVGSAHAFFHGEVYRKRSGPAE